MDISINAKVRCWDGPCGESTLVILNPTNQEITHIVVSNASVPEIEYLLSIDLIAESSHDEIRLNCTCEELVKMPVFDRIEFIPTSLTGFSGGPYWIWPSYIPLIPSNTLVKDHIPEGELTIRRGAGVEAADGHAGRVDEFIINSDDHINHLVMREGHLWSQKDITIPASEIDHYKDNKVYLKLKKKDIEKLPSVPVRHSWINNE